MGYFKRGGGVGTSPKEEVESDEMAVEGSEVFGSRRDEWLEERRVAARRAQQGGGTDLLSGRHKPTAFLGEDVRSYVKNLHAVRELEGSMALLLAENGILGQD